MMDLSSIFSLMSARTRGEGLFVCFLKIETFFFFFFYLMQLYVYCQDYIYFFVLFFTYSAAKTKITYSYF